MNCPNCGSAMKTVGRYFFCKECKANPNSAPIGTVHYTDPNDETAVIYLDNESAKKAILGDVK